MPEPDVSIIIPLYNKGPHIARALNSVLMQTFQNFEVIVVDSSTDEGTKIVRQFQDSRISLIHQEKSGVSAARNYGIEVARAGMIAFLDADDEWMPEHLNTLLRLRERYPDAGAYGTACLITVEGSSPLKVSYSPDIPKEPWEGLLPRYFNAAAFGFPPITTSAVAIPKDVFRVIGGFSTATWLGEDGDLWGRIALKYPIAFSWDGMGIYHTEAINRACNRIKPHEEHIFVRTAIKAIEAGEVSPDMQMDLREYIARIQIVAAYHNIRIGEQKLARYNLKKCETEKLVGEKYTALFFAYAPPCVSSLLLRIKKILF